MNWKHFLVPPLIVLTSTLRQALRLKEQDKVHKEMIQRQVGSDDYSWLVILSRPVVPEGMTQVWRQSEVKNHKQRPLNTWLSSGTSEHTWSSSRNALRKMIRSDLFWYWNKIKSNRPIGKTTFRIICFQGFMSTLKLRSIVDCSQNQKTANGTSWGPYSFKHKYSELWPRPRPDLKCNRNIL